MRINIRHFECFLRMSTALSGFNRIDLLGTGMSDAYFETVSTRIGDEVAKILWESVESHLMGEVEANEAEIIRKIFLSDPMFGDVCRAISKLWYLGQWEALPGRWRSTYGNHLSDVNEIISSESYKEGLVWKAIGAHPMGAKQPGFGTWSEPPEVPN